MLILVTGCAGFIGYHLTHRLLALNHQVVGVDSLNSYYSTVQKERNLVDLEAQGKAKGVPWHFRFIKGDIGSPQILSLLPQVDLVFHLAAYAGVRYSLEHPRIYFDTNVIASTNLMEWMRVKGVKTLFFASSSSVYGLNTKVPFSETDQIELQNSPYAISKLALERMTQLYSRLHGLNCYGFRFFTVYGPRGRPDMAPYKFLTRIMQEQTIQLYGDGNSRRDYTYVGDIVDGLVQAMNAQLATPQTGQFELFNIGSGRPLKLTDFVAVIEQVTGKKAQIEWLPDQPGDVPHTYADTSKLQTMCGFQPATSLEQGIKATYEWLLNKIET